MSAFWAQVFTSVLIQHPLENAQATLLLYYISIKSHLDMPKLTPFVK